MNKTNIFLASATLVFATTVSAQDQQSPARLEEIQAERDLVKARTELVEAEQNRAAQALAPLQELADQGKNELGSNGGNQEGAYLATLATRAAAFVINKKVSGKGSQYIVLSGDDQLSFDSLIAFRFETRGLLRAFDATLAQQNVQECQLGAKDGTGSRSAAFIGALGSVLGLLQSETKVSGINSLSTNSLLLSALTALSPNQYVVPSDILIPIERRDSETVRRLSKLEECLVKAREILPELSKDRKERIKTLIGTASTYLADLLSAKNGKVKLATIIREAEIARGDRKVLRINLERSGATLMTRRNLFTALGARAIGVSGGVSATYRLTDFRDGSILSSGVIVCRTKVKDIKDAIEIGMSDVSCDAASGVSPAITDS